MPATGCCALPAAARWRGSPRWHEALPSLVAAGGRAFGMGGGGGGRLEAFPPLVAVGGGVLGVGGGGGGRRLKQPPLPAARAHLARAPRLRPEERDARGGMDLARARALRLRARRGRGRAPRHADG